MRHCLLRWQDERLFPTFGVFGYLCHRFSLNGDFRECLQLFIYKGDTGLAYEISPMYRESRYVSLFRLLTIYLSTT
jgi:hypothetical protein